MGFSKKGFRKVEVDGSQYLWKINHKRPYFSEFGYLSMHAAIQLDAEIGSKLIVNLNMAPPKNYALGEDPRIAFKTITPRDINEYILEALSKGWKPYQNGKPYELRVNIKEDIAK